VEAVSADPLSAVLAVASEAVADIVVAVVTEDSKQTRAIFSPPSFLLFSFFSLADNTDDRVVAGGG
jgi:hypothetical protein